jgi:flavorubredoxin
MKQAHCIYQDRTSTAGSPLRAMPTKPGYLIDTNEYVVVERRGSAVVRPRRHRDLSGGLSRPCRPSAIRPSLAGIFASHQDPDIISSLALWLEFKPDLKCYTSWLWQSFLPHFGGHRLAPSCPSPIQA